MKIKKFGVAALLAIAVSAFTGTCFAIEESDLNIGGIYLGQPIEIDKKLDRLRKFYSYGLSQTGWNRYSRINVEFDNQIICKQRPKGRR